VQARQTELVECVQRVSLEYVRLRIQRGPKPTKSSVYGQALLAFQGIEGFWSLLEALALQAFAV